MAQLREITRGWLGAAGAVVARMTLTEAFQQFTRDLIELEREWTDERELSGLRCILGDARHHLCHAFVVLEGGPPYEDLDDRAQVLAREAYLSVLGVGQLLVRAREDLMATPCGLEQGAHGVHVMLDHLAPYVSRADVALRRTLLEEQPVDDALADLAQWRDRA
jgi:hypothetical protein